MGQSLCRCCFSPKSDDEFSERTHILDDPLNQTNGRQNFDCLGQRSGQDLSYGSFGQNSGQNNYSQNQLQSNGRNLEQNQLNNTLHKLVAKVIDVSSIDSSIVDSDLNERQKMYEKRLLSCLKKPLCLRSKVVRNANPSIQRNVSNIFPINDSDLDLINYFSEKSLKCVKNGLKIECEEAFVVQFDP